jgi:IclR family transcriptional regulator, acetate operon repressor
MESFDSEDRSENHKGRSSGSAPLARAFLLLETVLEAAAPISIAELANRADIPKPTVHRLVSNLIAEGMLRTDPVSHGLAPGARVMGLLCRAQSASWPGGPVRAVIEQLVGDVRESCNLGVLDRDAVLYVERVECDWPIRVQFGAGSRVPLHASAIGKLLLAHMPARGRRRMLETIPRPAFTSNTLTDIAELESQFKDIRRQGYALNQAENTDGLIGLAVPVRLQSNGNANGKRGASPVIAGLSVHAPSARLDIQGALALLARFEDAAEQLSALLGSGDGA